MIINKTDKSRIVNASVLLTIIAFSMFFQYPWFQNKLIGSKNDERDFSENEKIQTSETDYYTTEWLQNGNFSSGSYWNPVTTGDTSDFNLAISGGAATYKVMGEQRSFSLSESPIVGSNWLAVQNPQIPYLPTSVYSDSEGLKASHTFVDNGDANQIPSVHWDRNFTMPVDMADYVITSASFQTVVNATVSEDIDVYSDYLNGYYATDGGAPLNQYDSFDYVRFYVLLSDLSKAKTYELGYYQPPNLGAGNPPGTDTLTDTNLVTVSEEVLIFYLTSVLSSDNYNFTVSIGINIYCADSSTTYDTDTFTELLVKEIDLSFTYEKKIDQLNQASWRQDASTIQSNYIIENATLNFQYKIDKDWTANTGSLNSEFRIIINTNQLGQTVKLSTATSSYQDFAVGGLDVSSFISPDEDVNVSIQIYIGDEFNLDTEITVSIDNVSLMIGYGIFTPPDTTSYDLLLNDIDRTTEKSTQVTYGENLNVTFVYKNSTGDFIPGADVYLSGGGLPLTSLTPDLINEQYYKIIDTTDLGVGTSYLTLSASKRYHTPQDFQISVTVTNRDTELQLFLNGANETINKETIIAWNENLNITIKYMDLDNTPKTHISSANIELTGAGATKILSEDGTNEQYEYSLNSSILGVGPTFLTVYASKDNYSSLNIRFKITVTSRTTFLDNIELDGTVQNSIEIEWNEIFDVTLYYRDFDTNNPITEAEVQLLGTNYNKIFTPSGNFYTLTVDTFDLSIGNNFLTILAQKDNYSIASQLITIIVNERDTQLDIYLDGTPTNVIEIAYGESLNITASYIDFATSNFISGATVDVNGSGVSEVLIESYNNYTILIDTTELNLGPNFLTIYAFKENYTAKFKSLTIIVGERDSQIDIYLDGTPTTVIEIAYGESVNITATYIDFATTLFINGATVDINGSSISEVLIESYNNYTVILDTTELNFGVNFLTLYARKEGYKSQSITIVIQIIPIETTLKLYLDGEDKTLNPSIETYSNQLVNLTVSYIDFTTSLFISGATVDVNGSGVSEVLIESYNNYTVMLDTSDLNFGANFLTIYARKEGYGPQSIIFTIQIIQIETTLNLYLDGEDKTLNPAITTYTNQLINLTVSYDELISGLFISGATVDVNGSGVSEVLIESYNNYTVMLDTSELNFGANFLTIYARKEGYEPQSIIFTIQIIQIETTLNLYLDGEDKTLNPAMTTYTNQLFNLTVSYIDFATSFFISGATVDVNGSGVSEVLIESYNNYTVMLDTSDLNFGANFLTIYARKEGYEPQSITLTIQIVQIETTLNLYLDGEDKTSNPAITAYTNQLINLTVSYEEYISTQFINGATIDVNGSGVSEVLVESYSNYTVMLDTTDLNFGANFLTIYARKGGYEAQSIIFTIQLVLIETELTLYLNGEDKTLNPAITAYTNQLINLTVSYEEYISTQFINGATIDVNGSGVSEVLVESYSNYTVMLDTTELGFGANFLTIYARKDGYDPQTIKFTIQIIQIETELDIYLNDDKNPIDNSIKVTIGDSVNVTVIYKDDSSIFIDNADIIIVGEGIEQLNLTKDLTYDQYYVPVNTLDLNFGINLLTLYAQKANYQPQTLIIRIEINEKETDMEVYLNEIPQTTQDRSINLPIKALLNITVKYFDNETRAHIPGSVIQLVGEGLTDYYLTEYASLEQYSISINTTLLDIGVRFLTIYATHANFQSYSALLRIQVERIKTNITTTSGAIVFNREPGDDFNLELQLRDTDFNTNVLKANVSYTWVYGQGTLKDPDNDGTYSTTLTNLREGTFQITITVYAGDDYDFDRFFVTLNVIRPPEDVLLFQILTIAGIAAAVGISAYLIAYQRVLKYPKQVRKIRKFKKKLKKSKASGIDTLSRDEIIDKNYAEKIHPLEKQIKGKITPQSTESEINKNKIDSSTNLESQ
jgi:sRNA-binding regulator protein Hfq